MLRQNAVQSPPSDPAPPFHNAVYFDDVAPEILAREAADTGDSWHNYMLKMLPPVVALEALA